MNRATLWISVHSYKTVQNIELNSMVDKHITCDWSYSIQFYNFLQFGERVDTNRVTIQLLPDHSNSNTYIQQLENFSANLDIDVYGFVDSVDNTKNINHNEEIIDINIYSFESGSDISHSLTSSRIIGVVSDTRADTSALHTYSEQMILYPMFPVMERTSYNNESSFFGQQFGVPFNLITDYSTLEGSCLQNY